MPNNKKSNRKTLVKSTAGSSISFDKSFVDGHQTTGFNFNPRCDFSTISKMASSNSIFIQI